MALNWVSPDVPLLGEMLIELSETPRSSNDLSLVNVLTANLICLVSDVDYEPTVLETLT